MWSFGALCDEFYVRSRLFLKLDLNPSRESLLHFFEQIRKAFPQMLRLARNEDGAVVLRDRGDDEGKRYLRLDAMALKFGILDPAAAEDVNAFADVILTQAPPHLSLSDLDNDYLELSFGFDFEYSGNHDELVSETLIGDSPLLAALAAEGGRVINYQPRLGVALSADCATQAQITVRSRTSAFEVRSGDYEPLPVSVYLNVRRYWGGNDAGEDLGSVHRKLVDAATDLASGQVVPKILQPLAEAIASRR